MAKLLQDHREHCRSVARRNWINFHGDESLAKAAAEEQIRSQPGSIITSLLIGLAVRLIFALIEHWAKNREIAPSVSYQRGEPGYLGFEDVDAPVQEVAPSE